ncbi:MAG: HAMP domain-containing sensor histidine kinase, partial [Salegentibacter sp.]
EIARTLAHELRNPLASIGMAAELLEKKVDPSQREELKNYIDILSRSTATLNNLVSNLLNTSNYSPAVLRKEDLAEILKSTIEKAADRIYLAGIKVISKFDGPYPILADKEKLIIALLNIIVNASEATTPDHGIIEIAVTKNKTDFILSIRDNGHGLEQDQIDKLFEAFYTNKSTGVGVGLSSVKTILEDHDAPVKVTSKPNVGTCFDISFHNASLE